MYKSVIISDAFAQFVFRFDLYFYLCTVLFRFDLISRYRGSYLKGASCSPLESLTKIFSPIICLRSALMNLMGDWGDE